MVRTLGQRINWAVAIGIVAVLMLLVAAGCSDDDDDNGGGDETPVATEDGADGDADEQAIRDLVETAAAAWNAGDVDAFLGQFTDAGVLASFDAPREAAMEFLTDFIGDSPISAGKLTNFSVSGESATADAEEFAFGIVYDPVTFSFLKSGDAWLIDGEEDLAVQLPEGVTAVDISLLEYQFAFDASEITSGNFAFNVSNIGGEQHELALVSVPADADIAEGISQEEFPEGFEVLGVAGPWEPGTETSVVFTEELAAGRYAMLCFVESADGTPHAFLGMINEFTIE